MRNRKQWRVRDGEREKGGEREEEREEVMMKYVPMYLCIIY